MLENVSLREGRGEGLGVPKAPGQRMSRRRSIGGCGLALGLLVSASLGAATPTATTTPQIYAAYVLLAETPPGNTVAYARVILDPQLPCPSLQTAQGPALATTPRRNPHGFPVQVCEARYPFGIGHSLPGFGTLPAVSTQPEQVMVLGDTGCKPKDQGDCDLQDSEWALPQLVKGAVVNPPDLVIHVGDYNYRGTPSSFKNSQGEKTYYYDAGDGADPAELCGLTGPYYSQNSSGNPDTDAWEAWWLDFFLPAQNLLSAAPWVFSRGNHELCSHAGPGYFYFLDGSSDLGSGQLSCPSQDGGGPALPHLQLVPPQVLRLGSLELLVLDSANACDELPGLADTYQQQFAAVTPRLTTGKAWLVGHRPVWGVAGKGKTVYDCAGQPVSGDPPTYGQLNTSLQCALAGPTGTALLPKLAKILAGHMHRFESLAFSAPTQRPPTLVVGNGGVAEDSGPPTGAFSQTLDGGNASGFSVASFGYLELTATSSGWAGAIVALDPTAWQPYVAPCSASSAQSLCVKPLPTTNP